MSAHRRGRSGARQSAARRPSARSHKARWDDGDCGWGLGFGFRGLGLDLGFRAFELRALVRLRKKFKASPDFDDSSHYWAPAKIIKIVKINENVRNLHSKDNNDLVRTRQKCVEIRRFHRKSQENLKMT